VKKDPASWRLVVWTRDIRLSLQMTAICNPSEHHSAPCQRALLVMPVLLGSADVIGYLGNNTGPNNILLFENILQEDTFIW
jgi:hypothetical protein